MKVEFPKVNNKLAFFDFDRTLVAHKYSAAYSKASADSYFAECLYALTSLEKEHANDRPLPCMQWYAKKLFDDGYGLYVLTHEIFNLRDGLKQAQLKEFYPDTPMTYLTVDSPERKVDMMTAVALAEECDISDVIFVDDKMETVKLALAAGINAMHLSDIVVMYESSMASQQQGTVLKPKGLSEFLEEDPSLTQKVTYEEITGAGGSIDDSEMENVYRECKILAEMNGRSGNDMDGGALL